MIRWISFCLLGLCHCSYSENIPPGGILTWCIWEKTAHKPSAAFFRTDWQKKPIAQAWEQLVKEERHTDEAVQTDVDGKARVHGFLGLYKIKVSSRGAKVDVAHSLLNGCGECVVELDSAGKLY